ncbi:porin [Rhodoblastus acidophilus]|uniref:Porin n=1 Tax=Candidatus Rhodoblastus alkanivorans TaxID=2954117 RepID=A0ABS9ZBU4_9HYPH|nr:porin [Candidatus Rhodoblastus alkanivorans]MCI4679400.1 porin [Candidatus Rhodoblastus alkanivorans]MCI4684876.1 porin [Candidatus Rhodoblastus alkanivorans]MDI4642200.1 porin [Rhodoblastus acidophilus]
MKKVIFAQLFAATFATGAEAADILSPKATGAPPPQNSCFSSLWSFLNSSADECPLSYGGLTLFANIDGGYGYEQWGVPLGLSSKKPNYGIQKNSGDTHWLWSPNGISTSVFGVKLNEKLGNGWRLIGVAEGGFSPYTLRLINGPRTLAENNLKKLAQQTSNSDSDRTGQWDNSQGFFGISNRTLGVLTFGRTNALSHSLLTAYDPVASVAFSQLGFSGAYSGFGVNSTTRVNTAVTYRLSYRNLRFAAQTQVGGYNQGNAATAQYQVQIGADIGGLSFDGVLHMAKDAAAFSSYSGSPTPAGYDPNSIVKATLANTRGVELLARYKYGPFRFYAGFIRAVLQNPSNSYPNGMPTGAYGIFVPPGAVTADAFTVPRRYQTVWTGVRYKILSNLSAAAGVYWDTQNDFLPAPGICTGSGSATSSSQCAGGRYSYSFLINYKPLKRIDVYAGAMVSNAYGGTASGYLHTRNIDPMVGVRIRF